MAIEKSRVWKLPGDYLIQMLKENFDLHMKMDHVLCQRLRYKSMVLSEISSYEPEHRMDLKMPNQETDRSELYHSF